MSYVSVQPCNTTQSTSKTNALVSLSGLGCGCKKPGGKPCGCLGDFSDDSGVLGIPGWVVAIAGAAAALFWLSTPGGSDYRQAKRRLREQYRGSTRLKKAAARSASSVWKGAS